MGVRLRPLTDDRPKALVEINGESFFARQLRFLRARGIKEITVVTGHRADAFAPWHGEPGLQFVHNPHYHDRNNFYTMYLVRQLLGDTIVLDGDIYLSSRVLSFVTTDRSGWYVGSRESDRDEWFVIQDANGRVTAIEIRPGVGRLLTGISYWRAADAKVMRATMEQWYAARNTAEIYWDEVPRALLDQLDLGAWPIDPLDCVEIDTVAELAALQEQLRGDLPLTGNSSTER